MNMKFKKIIIIIIIDKNRTCFKLSMYKVICLNKKLIKTVLKQYKVVKIKNIFKNHGVL